MPAFTRRQYAGAAAATTITAGINTTDTTCSLAATTGWPTAAGVPFYVVIDPGTSAEEKCSATISGSTLTLTRAQDDTTATSILRVRRSIRCSRRMMRMRLMRLLAS